MLAVKKEKRFRNSIDTPHFASQYKFGEHIHYSPPGYFVDSDIKRLGQPHSFTKEIQSEKTVVEALSASMTEDMKLAEKTFPQHTNVILCGVQLEPSAASLV